MNTNDKKCERSKGTHLNFHDNFSTAKFIKDISTKGLIIHDTKDPIIPYTDAEQIKKNHNNASLISTTGLGHSLNDKSVTKNILDFINS